MDIALTDILAVIGAAYTLAVAIVKLTPTPRDDEALARISPWLRALAKVFGLDLKQGIKTEGPPPRPPAILLLLCVSIGALLLAGCRTTSPAEQYVATAHSYAVAVHALAAAREAGQLPPEHIPAITAAVHTGRDLLDQWQAAIAEGRSAPDLAEAMRTVMAQLLAYQRATATEPH